MRRDKTLLSYIYIYLYFYLYVCISVFSKSKIRKYFSLQKKRAKDKVSGEIRLSLQYMQPNKELNEHKEQEFSEGMFIHFFFASLFCVQEGFVFYGLPLSNIFFFLYVQNKCKIEDDFDDELEEVFLSTLSKALAPPNSEHGTS